MIMLKIEIPCRACETRPEDQPNYCRRCGGIGVLRSVMSAYRVSQLDVIPTVLGASIVARPKRRRRQ